MGRVALAEACLPDLIETARKLEFGQAEGRDESVGDRAGIGKSRDVDGPALGLVGFVAGGDGPVSRFGFSKLSDWLVVGVRI